MPRALIIGVTGQDGSYLSEFLLKKGYQVGTSSRKSSSGNRWPIAHIGGRLEMFSADLVDQSSLAHVIEEFRPQVAKVYGHHFNHESPRRGLEFVTRKITRAAAAIKLGFVRAMWLMLQQETPDSYVVGTGQAHSVKDPVECAFNAAGLDDWQGYMETDPKLLRPAEMDYLVADASKATKVLGWRPETNFEQMIKGMVRHDLKILSQAKPDAQSACEPGRSGGRMSDSFPGRRP